MKQELTELGGLIGGFKIDEESVKTSKFIDFLTVKSLGHVNASEHQSSSFSYFQRIRMH